MQAENATDEYKLKIIRFIIKVLLTFNSELVERGEGKVSQDLIIANQVKDGVRQFAIGTILDMLQNTVLANPALFKKTEVQDVLNILA